MQDNHKISIFEGKLVYVVKKSNLVTYSEQNDYSKEDLKREIYHVLEERKLLSIRAIIYSALSKLTNLDVYTLIGKQKENKSLQYDPLFLELEEYIHQQTSYMECYNKYNIKRDEDSKKRSEWKKQKSNEYYYLQIGNTRRRQYNKLFK